MAFVGSWEDLADPTVDIAEGRRIVMNVIIAKVTTWGRGKVIRYESSGARGRNLEAISDDATAFKKTEGVWARRLKNEGWTGGNGKITETTYLATSGKSCEPDKKAIDLG